MHLTQILNLLTWPVLIVVTYYLVRFAIRKYRKLYPEDFAEDEKQV
ncbi:MAG TPA: hypothetical protein PLE85_04165 [Bacteroidales bacterium]|nr:hypothetical protein [Bacteroidales bacterium]